MNEQPYMDRCLILEARIADLQKIIEDYRTGLFDAEATIKKLEAELATRPST